MDVLHMKSTTFATSILGVFMVIGLIGCAQAGPTSTPADVIEQAKVVEQSQKLQCDPGKEWWRSAGPPKRGDTLVMSQSVFEHSDPTKGGGGGIGRQVYGTLLETRSCFSGDLIPVPSLAKSWQISPDGLTWTLKLRDDVKWHNKPPVNGRPFTSADVAWSIEHHVNEGTARPLWAGVKHSEPDPHTVVLRLDNRDADFAMKLFEIGNVMLPREVKEQFGDFRTTVIGTGAFMVKNVTVRSEVVSERNPQSYEMGVDGKPLPYLDQVRSFVFPDYLAELAAIRTGQLDSSGFSGYRKLDWEELKKSNPKFQPWEALQNTYHGVWFNQQTKPWNDVRVRKAVSLAIDRDDLIVSEKGGAVLSGFVPPFNYEFAWSESKVKDKFNVDREQAKKLLADAGYGAGQIKTVIKTSSLYQELAEVVAEQLKLIGIETTMNTEGQSFSPILNARAFELAVGITGGSTRPGYWAGDAVRTGNGFNYGGFSDTKVDALADAQAREMDSIKRKQLIDQQQELLFDLTPHVPTVSRNYYYVYSCRMKNAMRIPFNNAHNYQHVKEIWLDPTGC